jgi:hypothetical protein
LILPLVGAVGATALVYAANMLRIGRYLGFFALAVMLLLLQGGGPLTYIVSADASWLWNDTAVRVNEFMDNVFSPLIYRK